MADKDQKTPDQTPDAQANTSPEATKEKDAPKANAKKHQRTAKTQVKYAGEWYEPGTPVPFKTATDAEAYDAEGALEPEK